MFLHELLGQGNAFVEDLEDPLAAVVGVFSYYIPDGQDDLEATVGLGNGEEAWGWSEKEGCWVNT